MPAHTQAPSGPSHIGTLDGGNSGRSRSLPPLAVRLLLKPLSLLSGSIPPADGPGTSPGQPGRHDPGDRDVLPRGVVTGAVGRGRPCTGYFATGVTDRSSGPNYFDLKKPAAAVLDGRDC